MAKAKIFYGWFLVSILGVIYLIDVGFPLQGASVTNTYMAKALNLNRATLGLGFTVFLYLIGISSPVIGYCIRKMGIRFTLFVGCLFSILGSLLMALAVTKGWHYVVVFGVIVGAGTSLCSLIPLQTGVTLWFKKKKALAMSIALAIGSLGGFIAPPILDKIISLANGNWRMAWFFNAGLLLLSVLLALLFVKNKPSDMGLVRNGEADNDESPVVSDDWKAADALRTVTFWLLFIASLAYFTPPFMIMAHAAAYLRDMGHTPAFAAMVIGYLMLFSFAGRLVAGALGDRFEIRYIWSFGLMLEMVGTLCFLDARSVANGYLFSLFAGIGVGAASVCMPTLLGNYFGANSFASVMGILYLFVQLLAATSPFVAGLVYDSVGSYQIAFIAVAVLAFIGGVAILFAKPPNTCGP